MRAQQWILGTDQCDQLPCYMQTVKVLGRGNNDNDEKKREGKRQKRSVCEPGRKEGHREGRKAISVAAEWAEVGVLSVPHVGRPAMHSIANKAGFQSKQVLFRVI